MMTKKLKQYILIALISTAFNCVYAHQETRATHHHFKTLADAYFDQYFLPMHPTTATDLGVHTYDDQLDDYTKAGIQYEIKQLKQFEKLFLAVNSHTLDQYTQGDRELILNDIHSQLLTLETIRPWQKDPDMYSSGITNSAFSLMKRNFAPLDTRLKSLIAREKQMPLALQQARVNLNNPPKIFTEIALEQLPDTIEFFQKDVPLAFDAVKDPLLQKQFRASNQAVIVALKQYETWLKQSVLPKSHGDYRLGKTTFLKKLKYDEMVELPLDQLLAIGMNDLRKNQAEFNRIAKELDPTKTPQQMLTELGTHHPTADQLLKSFSDTFNQLIAFIQDKHIITIPSNVRPTMIETPPFMRATTLASMDTPGPFETQAKEAYFEVTLPDKNWDQAKINELLQTFNYDTISSTAIHEAYPGHYIQFLWMHNVHDRVRQILGANSNAEGWAHYCEQMMLDEGYANVAAKNEREAKLMKLGQLTDALLRDARYVVSIKLHTGNMSFDEAVKFFETEGYQNHSVGVMETKRGTSDATYLYYTLGKLEILQLRKDVESKEGRAFNLQTFHDNFMKQGAAPIKVVREAMLQDKVKITCMHRDR